MSSELKVDTVSEKTTDNGIAVFINDNIFGTHYVEHL